MPTIFEFRGQQFPMVERPLVPEIAAYERQARTGVNRMTASEQSMVTKLISAARAGIVIPWAEAMASVSHNDFRVVSSDEHPEEVDEDEDTAAVDPTPPAAAPADAADAVMAPATSPTPSTTSSPGTGSV